LKDDEKELLSKNPITALFYGKAEECITVESEEVSIIKKYNEAVFSTINIPCK